MQEKGKGAASAAAVFDRSAALAAVDHDLELLRELAAIFLEDVPRALDALRAAVRERDADGLRCAAHCLKGSVSALGAPSVAGLAHELERLGREGRPEAAGEALARFEGALGELTVALEELAAEEE